MKRIISICIFLGMIFLVLTGCSNSDSNPIEQTENPTAAQAEEASEEIYTFDESKYSPYDFSIGGEQDNVYIDAVLVKWFGTELNGLTQMAILLSSEGEFILGNSVGSSFNTIQDSDGLDLYRFYGNTNFVGLSEKEIMDYFELDYYFTVINLEKLQRITIEESQDSLTDDNEDSAIDNEGFQSTTGNGDYGKTITFDGFEITVSDNYLFKIVENRYSDYNGCEVVELPVHIKNVSDETGHLSSFDYSFFGPKGNELHDVAVYFSNDIFHEGELQPEGEYDTYFHFLYEGDGTYYINFKNYITRIEQEFEITKGEN